MVSVIFEYSFRSAPQVLPLVFTWTNKVYSYLNDMLLTAAAASIIQVIWAFVPPGWS